MTSTGKENGIGTWVLEIATNTLSWDDGMYCIYGVERNSFALTHKTFLSRIHPDDRNRVSEECEKAARGDFRQYEFSFQIIRPDGNARRIKAYVVTQLDKTGKPMRQVGVNWDVTWLKEAQQQLTSQETEIKDFKFALDQHAIVSIANAQSEITYANDKLCELSKYSRDELLGRDYLILSSEKYSKEFFDGLREATAQGKTWHGEIQNKAKNGSYFWIATTIVPFLDQNGKPFRYISISTDITEQKKNELLLIDSEKRLKLTASAAKVGIWDLNITHKSLHWDDTMCEIYGISSAMPSESYELWTNAIHPDDKERVLRDAIIALNGELSQFDLTYRIMRPDGAMRWVKDHGLVQHDASGADYHLLGTSFDITELKEAELQQREIAKELESASKAKGQFLANMSDEIRTPLTSIIGYCELLLDRQISASEQREAAGAVISSASYLLSIVNNILDMSRLEAKKVEVRLVRTDLFRLVDEILTIERQKIHDKQLNFYSEYCYPLPHFFHTDFTALKQILINITDNAIKFTRFGEVKIRVSFDRTRNMLSFSVKDTGIGISSEKLDRLFQVFSQGDSSTTRRFGGNGLGLAISKQLALLLGGNIIVESIPGRGSTFTVTVPAGPVSEKDITYTDQSKLRTSTPAFTRMVHFTGKVLVVEDSIEIQKYIRFLLTKKGLVVTIVDDGESAIDAALVGNYDLIIMDMHLPKMDGHTATSKIRECGLKTPILALTADVRIETVGRCFQSGCSDFLPKPFSRSGLVEKLSTLLKQPIHHKVVSAQNVIEDDYAADLKEFVDSFSKKIEELEQAHRSHNYEVLTQIAHKLAGAAAFAYPVVFESLILLEDAARERDVEACSHLLTKLSVLHANAGTP